MASNLRYEECAVCGDATGRAGRGDDSIYCDDCDDGPFCLDCWKQHGCPSAQEAGDGK
jgi:hypothetical protein